jgi:hypothetical protein
MLHRPVTRQGIEEVLRQPLRVGSRTVRYRFTAQRAGYLAAAADQAVPVSRTPRKSP